MTSSEKNMARTSPSVKDVLSSTTTVDGAPRVGFWDSSLQHARKEWAKLTFLTFGLITVFMFTFLSIYFGSYYDQAYLASNFAVEVIDLDGIASAYGSVAHPAILGPALQTAISNSENTDPHLGWFQSDASTLQTFRLSEEGQGVDAYTYALDRVLDNAVWAAVIVNANATSGVWEVLNSGTTYDPTGAMTFIFNEARNFYGSDQYVFRLGLEVMISASALASTQFANQVLALGNASAVLSSAPENTVSGGFAFNIHSPVPFDQFAGIPATTVGTIYIIIFTFLFSVVWNTFGLPILQDHLTLVSEVAMKIVVPFVSYFWLSLNYSLVSLAFLVKFDRLFGRGGFVVYWMANWVAMSALGFVMETTFLWLGPFFPFFLVFWVILNVSVAFIDIADMDRFYRYGWILPVWNLDETSKSIIFATKNHLVQNFAVNLGWFAVWVVLLAVTVVYQRRNKESAKMKAKWEEMKKKHEASFGVQPGENPREFDF